MSRRSTEHSETGFQSGLREVLLEVIAPALIMLMLGSLVFFSLEILYRGNHRLPIHWVFGLYVFAIVLVGRIAIMEGFARAQLFAFVLIGAVLFQTGFGPHVVVVLLTWWAASKLAWDCTFIDASRDVTGQGLVSAALERWKLFQEKFLQVWRGKMSLAQAIEPETHNAGDSNWTDHPTASVTRWMKELVWKQKRKNTPGLWAFFFFIAGLGLFAVGQLFVESTARARNYSLWMFAMYSFSGLGLMMFISLLGLFRYLKQRGTSMPDSIARSWLAVGTLFALAVAGIMLYLPWPNSGTSLSSWIPKFQTAKQSGDNSPLTERGKVEGPKGTGKLDDRGAPGQGDKPGEQQGKGSVAGGDQQGDQPQGKPGTASGGNVGGGKGPKPASSPSPPSQSSGKPEPSKSGKPNAQQKSDDAGSKDPPKQNARQPGDSPKPSGDGSKDGPKPTPGSQPQSQNQSATPQSSPPQSQAKNPTQPPPKQPPPDQALSERSSAQNIPPPSEQAKNPSQPKTPATNPPQASWLQTIFSFLQSIISILIWIAAIIVAFIVFARYRNEIIDGLGNFMKSLFELFSRWFGGKKSTDGSEPEAVGAAARHVPHKPFSSFRNPFENADWNRRPPAELVEYSFAAFEALARDVKTPRQSDETPLEFARRISESHDSLQGSRQLAELYSLAAYAAQKLSAAEVAPLRAFWGRMRSFSQRVTPPQAVGTA